MRLAHLAVTALFMMITTHASMVLSCPDRGDKAGMPPRSTILESSPPGTIQLGPQGVRISLRPADHLPHVAPGEVLRRAVATRRLLLLLCDIRAAQTPETLFHIYLNLPNPADEAARAAHLLAQINFFSALRPDDRMPPIWQSVDVTGVVGALAAQGRIETAATLTILAARPFDPASRPSIGRIAIVQQ